MVFWRLRAALLTNILKICSKLVSCMLVRFNVKKNQISIILTGSPELWHPLVRFPLPPPNPFFHWLGGRDAAPSLLLGSPTPFLSLVRWKGESLTASLELHFPPPLFYIWLGGKGSSKLAVRELRTCC